MKLINPQRTGAGQEVESLRQRANKAYHDYQHARTEYLTARIAYEKKHGTFFTHATK